MERRQLGKVRPRVGGSPVGRGSGVDEEDFLKDKRSPSLGDMLNMYLFSSPARKAVIALIVVVLVCIFFFPNAYFGIEFLAVTFPFILKQNLRYFRFLFEGSATTRKHV